MGDKYHTKHQRKNPKRTPEQIKKDRIERKQDKELIKNGKAKESKRTFKESTRKQKEDEGKRPSS